jgi:tetratricopeptide (TPR) repeat protein
VATDSLVARAEQAFLQGKLWRAKEILQGGIRARSYDSDLYERYGNVLLKMGDLLEAGKYLFLCGKRELAYENAISLFLGRFARTNPLQLYSAFPRGARLQRRDDYPAPVNVELEKLGFPEVLPAPHEMITQEPAKVATEVRALSCLAVVVFGLAVLGVIHIVQWLGL